MSQVTVTQRWAVTKESDILRPQASLNLDNFVVFFQMEAFCREPQPAPATTRTISHQQDLPKTDENKIHDNSTDIIRQVHSRHQLGPGLFSPVRSVRKAQKKEIVKGFLGNLLQGGWS